MGTVSLSVPRHARVTISLVIKDGTKLETMVASYSLTLSRRKDDLGSYLP